MAVILQKVKGFGEINIIKRNKFIRGLKNERYKL